MIRINLLPHRRRQDTSGPSPIWILVILGALAVEAGAFFLHYNGLATDLAQQEKENRELDTQLKSLKKQVAGSEGTKSHAKILEEIKQLRDREDAIITLQQRRVGPAPVLLELAKVLTTGRGPTVAPEVLHQTKKTNPDAVYDPNWDARRVWLTSYTEENRDATLVGYAVTAHDVSELALRMGMSEFFTGVEQGAASQARGALGVSVMRFTIKSRVRY